MTIKDSLINFASGESYNFLKDLCQFLMPTTTTLFQAVDCFAKLKDTASRIQVGIVQRLTHVNVFVISEFSIKISPFDVDLMKLEVQACGEGKNSMKRSKFSNRCVHIKVVNSLHLGKALCD